MEMKSIKERVLDPYRSRLREKAISKAKVRIALAHKKSSDFTEEELEEIVYDEEKKIEANLRNLTFAGLLLAVGIG